MNPNDLQTDGERAAFRAGYVRGLRDERAVWRENMRMSATDEQRAEAVCPTRHVQSAREAQG